ncbi:inner membrane complex associated protein 4, putative [Eimeria necatrix]|uniref:Inner membrane complex associated protein 4, putative n=1 Tax=Eimeria necatrix TaxID=51315 RepID=U6N1G3_9EIME|nr:inner membrane complex associated protein 4, putative [Eimeria necatrix]CDJ69143.1 inner membrane complex associated protein 4, putative [Eimeria necatrix]
MQGQTGPGRPDVPRRWNGPPIDLFPSRPYNNNRLGCTRGSCMPTPVASLGNQYGSAVTPPQEAFGTHSVHQTELSASASPSWERMGPPMSSAPDRLLGPPIVGRPNAAGESRSTREWLEVTAYQPVDVVTRTVEVPVTRTVDVYVPKPVVREKVVEVPKLVPKYIEKIVEVPQIEWVERVVEVPEVMYNTKIVPKVEIRENIVEKPVFCQKWVEKIVEVSVVEEVIRYRTIHEPEEIIKYIPNGHEEEEWRGSPILTIPPHQTPELPPKWGGTPQPSPRHPLVKAALQRS